MSVEDVKGAEELLDESIRSLIAAQRLLDEYLDEAEGAGEKAEELRERLDRLIEATKALDDLPSAEGGYLIVTQQAVNAAVLAARELRYIVRGLLEVVKRGGQLARAEGGRRGLRGQGAQVQGLRRGGRGQGH
jgi:ElaB/YqjD/DUF883 family membrane-anchored ribosome-binding protein